tara:strand:+ start:1908 stop:2510 length:603 start_codon:yes stop_codon:yes gene_type:complete
MKEIYKEYFQKSKVFLYPLLGIKKGMRFVPIQTYTSWTYKDTILPEEKCDGENGSKFCCLYLRPDDQKSKSMYLSFLDEIIKDNKFYYKSFPFIHNSIEFDLVLFDMPAFELDMIHFRKGHYSKMSELAKKRIMNFFGPIGTISQYVESYLYPHHFYEEYSELLNIPIELLEEVGELCDKPNKRLEEFKREYIHEKMFIY